MLTKMNTLRIVNVSSLFYSHDFVQDISNLFKNLTQRHTTETYNTFHPYTGYTGLEKCFKAFFKHEN